MDYKPPYLFRNGHFNTIYPNLFRKVKSETYERISMATTDHDFIDLDTVRRGNPTLLLLLHGLEGDSTRHYIKGMVNIATRNHWDAIAMNHRGCSGRPNKLLSAYHSGKTDDLRAVLQFISSEYDYENILIAGFSLSGNLLLKFAGEEGPSIDKNIKGIAAISVPCALSQSAEVLDKGFNKIYQRRFMKTLKAKALDKLHHFNNAPYTAEQIEQASTFRQFDDLFTGPVHGFANAAAYWQQCSSKAFIPSIATKTLVLNALDDPFLAEGCYPYQEAEANPVVHLETPKYGGHVGFVMDLKAEYLYSELRAEAFFGEVLKNK